MPECIYLIVAKDTPSAYLNTLSLAWPCAFRSVEDAEYQCANLNRQAIAELEAADDEFRGRPHANSEEDLRQNGVYTVCCLAVV